MKARKPRRVHGAKTADLGTPERARQGELLPRPTALAGVVGRRVKYECRLDWYWDKASINDRQHEAGIRFRHDWHLAAAAPKTVATYGPRLGKGFEFHEVQIAARPRRTRRADARRGVDVRRHRRVRLRQLGERAAPPPAQGARSPGRRVRSAAQRLKRRKILLKAMGRRTKSLNCNERGRGHRNCSLLL